MILFSLFPKLSKFLQHHGDESFNQIFDSNKAMTRALFDFCFLQAMKKIWIFNTKLYLTRIPYVSSDWGPLQEKFENFYLTFSISLSAIAVQVNR